MYRETVPMMSYYDESKETAEAVQWQLKVFLWCLIYLHFRTETKIHEVTHRSAVKCLKYALTF